MGNRCDRFFGRVSYPLERQEKQAHERQAEKQFSQLGPTIRPLWLLVLGGGLVLIALLIWMFLATRP